jgi:hypothetical protein
MSDLPLAPPGWGFPAGMPICLSVEDLPDLPLLAMLEPSARNRALTQHLIDHPTITQQITAGELSGKYPCIDIRRLWEIVANAKRGRLPNKPGRRAGPKKTL